MCQLAQALEDAGEMSCGLSVLAMCCIPCWNPFMTAKQITTIEEKLGGQPSYSKECLLMCFCTNCTICRVARAVNKAKEQGLIKRGSPQADAEMAR